MDAFAVLVFTVLVFAVFDLAETLATGIAKTIPGEAELPKSPAKPEGIAGSCWAKTFKYGAIVVAN